MISKRAIVLFVLLVLTISGLAYSGKLPFLKQQVGGAEVSSFFVVDKPYPVIGFVDLDGENVDIHKASGKIKIIELAAAGCPASQSFSGAHQYGAFKNQTAQTGLTSFQKLFEEYSKGFSLEDDSDLFEYYRVLVLNEENKATTSDDLKAWSEHFHLNENKNLKLLRLSTKDQNLFPMSAIPGFQIVDVNGVLRHSLLDSSQQIKLYDILPEIGQLAEAVSKKSSDENLPYLLRDQYEEKYKKLADHYVETRDFAGIEELANELSKDREFTPTLGSVLNIFYEKIKENSAVPVFRREDFAKFLYQWSNVYPKSVHRPIIAAMAEHEYAWKARSERYSSAVSEESFKTFKEHVDKAREYLEQAEEIDPSNNSLTALKIHNSRLDSSMSSKDALEIYEEGKKHNPYNFLAALEVSQILLPRWKGSAEELASFLESVDADTSEKYGHSFYAKIAFVISSYKGHEKNLAEDLGFKWDLVDSGFQYLEQKYPEEEFNLQQHIKTALAFDQYLRAAELLEKAPTVWTDAKGVIWRNRRSYRSALEKIKQAGQNYPLHLAVINGDTGKLDQILQSGVDINSKDVNGKTALQLAVENANSHMFLELTKKGAKFDVKDSLGQTPLITASREGDVIIVNFLLQNGARLDVANQYGETALHKAAERGHEEVVSLLLFSAKEPKSDFIDIKNRSGRTALMLAARWGHKEIVAKLLDAGADINLQDINSYTALHFAATNGYDETISLLLGKNAKSLTSSEGFLPIDLARQAGHESTVEILEKQ